MKDMYNDRTKSNAQLISTQNSYPEQINKIRYNYEEYGGIINPLNIKLKPKNKMNILPYKPIQNQKQLSSELNYQVICIIILVSFVLGFASFLLVHFLQKSESKSNIITATFIGKEKKIIVLFNEKFEKLIDKIILKEDKNSLRHLDQEISSRIYNNTNNKDSIEIDLIFKSSILDLSYMFEGCSNLTKIVLSNISSSNINNLSNMFANCYNLEEINLESFDTSKVKRMDGLFKGCNNLPGIIGLEQLDTSSLNNITGMFVNCGNIFYINLSSFDLDKIAEKENVFDNNSNLQYIDLRNSKNIINYINKIFNIEFIKKNNQSRHFGGGIRCRGR